MDDIVQRTRYLRYNTAARRKKKSNKGKLGFTETIVKQLFFSVLILLLIVIVKSVNTPVTNYLSDNVQKAVFHDIELKGLYKDMSGLFKKFAQADVSDIESDDFDKKPESESMVLPGIKNSTIQDMGINYCCGEEIALPIEGTLGTKFGNKIHPIKNSAEFHHGIDIEVKCESIVKAVLSGVVIEVGSKPSYGRYIRLKHDSQMETVYAHCSSIVVSEGQEIKQGDSIARIAETGNVAGSHLHFEIWEDGEPVDPLKYIKVPEM